MRIKNGYTFRAGSSVKMDFPPFRKVVYSERKGFALNGRNRFLSDTFIQKGLNKQESKQKVTKTVYLVKGMAKNLADVLIRNK